MSPVISSGESGFTINFQVHWLYAECFQSKIFDTPIKDITRSWLNLLNRSRSKNTSALFNKLHADECIFWNISDDKLIQAPPPDKSAGMTAVHTLQANNRMKLSLLSLRAISLSLLTLWNVPTQTLPWIKHTDSLH